MAGKQNRRLSAVLVLLFGIVVVFAQLSGPCCQDIEEGDYDAFFDFKNEIIKNFTGVSVIEGFEGAGCSSRGVLKLTVSKDIMLRKRILIDLGFHIAEGWVFNLGDSRTNNGWGGDEGTQSRNAEFQLIGILSGHLSEVYGSGIAFSMANHAHTRMTILVGDEHTVWIPDCDVTGVNYYNGPGWFALGGQHDRKGGVNYDLYLGINRVVGTPSFVGSGVCKVGIKFVTEL